MLNEFAETKGRPQREIKSSGLSLLDSWCDYDFALIVWVVQDPMIMRIRENVEDAQ